MYVYLDESGDTGFKFRNGSSRYFVIALLLVDEPLPLHQAVHDLRLRLNKSESYEFKFMRTHHDGRIAFFQAIKPFTFQVHALSGRQDEPRVSNSADEGILIQLSRKDGSTISWRH